MPIPIKDLSEISAEALVQFKKALAQSNRQQGDPRTTISKTAGISQATGLVWYDLQAPAKNLFPVLTPLRNRIPRVPGNGGTATNWISVTGINTAGLSGFVPEGVRNGLVTTAASPVSATYKALGLEDAVTFEAELAADNFENVRSTTGQRLLWATMLQEEYADLGANGSAVALGTPTMQAPVAAAAGGTIPNATHYYVNVVALTLQGYQNASMTAFPGLTSVTPADGSSAFTYGGGASLPSAQADVTTLTSTSDWGLKVSCTAIAGAVAYAWFMGTATSGGKLQAITTINSALLTSYSTTSTRPTLPTNSDDYSKNAYAYDGILYQAWKSGSGAYVKTLATGTQGTGTKLTSNGAGGVTELDVMFQDRWDNYRLPVDEIWVSSQEALSITKLCLNNGASTYPIMQTIVSQGEIGGITAGGRVKSILNNFAMNGKADVPISIHPNLPAGTLMGLTWNLPYPVTGIPNIIEKKLRRDYYQMEWPLRTRKYESGVYFDGVLAVYFAPSISIISNIAP